MSTLFDYGTLEGEKIGCQSGCGISAIASTLEQVKENILDVGKSIMKRVSKPKRKQSGGGRKKVCKSRKQGGGGRIAKKVTKQAGGGRNAPKRKNLKKNNQKGGGRKVKPKRKTNF